VHDWVLLLSHVAQGESQPRHDVELTWTVPAGQLARQSVPESSRSPAQVRQSPVVPAHEAHVVSQGEQLTPSSATVPFGHAVTQVSDAAKK